MARGCLENCPLFNRDIEKMKNGIYVYGLNVEKDLNTILGDCEASYGCPGPELTEIEVVKGIFKKHIETKTQYVCRRPDQN